MIKEGQTTITKEEYQRLFQHHKGVIAIASDGLRTLKLEKEELEQTIIDTAEALEKLRTLEVM